MRFGEPPMRDATSSDEIILRNLKSADLESMAEILSETWDFGTYEDESAEKALRFMYLLKNAKEATEILVAEKEGAVFGYLFGRIPHRPQNENRDHLTERFKEATSDWIAHTNDAERSAWETEWSEIEAWYKERYSELGKTAKNASYIDLFVVTKAARGCGIGTKLLNVFKRLHEVSNPGQYILLQTDTWCGWRFYEKKGFTRLAEAPAKNSLTWDKENYENHAFFLYGARF